MLKDEWNLPGTDRIETIRLMPMELLLIDWILCTGSSLLLAITDDLVSYEWHTFRTYIWKAFIDNRRIVETPQGPRIEAFPEELGTMCNLSESEAKVLLTACPTTFTWGDGLDCGLSLKTKIAQMLLGTYADPELTAQVEAEKKALEDTKSFVESKLKTAETNLSTAVKSYDISHNVLAAKEKEAERIRDDTVKNARADVNAGELKVTSTQEDLDIAILEAREYGIYPNSN